MTMPNPNTSDEELFSDKACRELSELLERSWNQIRGGMSDLRPIESQIKGIFKKELMHLIQTNREAYVAGIVPEKLRFNEDNVPKWLKDDIPGQIRYEQGFNAAIEAMKERGKV
jgi:hypothetical protein